jgi:nucleotide-binding universal stress UspA family protein
MYDRILVALDVSPTDEAIIEHIIKLALAHHSKVILLRVAHYHTRDRMAHEVEEAEDYLRGVAERIAAQGVEVESVMGRGEPAEEIVRQALERNVDLIAMATHGHKGLYDIVFGSVSDDVRHDVFIPVLLIRSPRPVAERNPEGKD